MLFLSLWCFWLPLLLLLFYLYIFTSVIVPYEKTPQMFKHEYLTTSKPDTVSWKAVQLLTLFQVSAAGSSSLNAAGRNALVTSLMVCCGFIACWSINDIVFFLNTVGILNIDFSGWFYNFTIVLVLLNSCINPFIYAAKYSDFQSGVRRLLQNKVHSVMQVSSVPVRWTIISRGVHHQHSAVVYIILNSHSAR